VSLHLNKSVNDYLVDLLDKLYAVADLATTRVDRAQQNYVDRYNLRARDKHFKEGDLVVVLAADNPVNCVRVGSDLLLL